MAHTSEDRVRTLALVVIVLLGGRLPLDRDSGSRAGLAAHQ